MTTLDESPVLRPMRFDGERRWALALEMAADQDPTAFVETAHTKAERAKKDGAALVYGLVDERHADLVFSRLGWTSVGPATALWRPLRLRAAAERLKVPEVARGLLPKTALVLPFGRGRRAGVREITVPDPRVTRLWDRFSIDVAVAIERNAKYIDSRIWGRPDAGYRVFVFEDGDRYVIRALCIFRQAHVVELLHDRSMAGMRAASHLLGLALREMSDAGAESVLAWSLVSSGSYPIYARHAFLPAQGAGPRTGVRLGVRAFDPALDWVVSERQHWYLSGLDFDGV